LDRELILERIGLLRGRSVHGGRCFETRRLPHDRPPGPRWSAPWSSLLLARVLKPSRTPWPRGRPVQALTPKGSPAAALLEAARPRFNPTGDLPPPSLTASEEAKEPLVEDPITAALRRDPEAAELASQQRNLATTLRHSASAEAWRT